MGKIESKEFRLSKVKIKYMIFKFSSSRRGKAIVKIRNNTLSVTVSFKYQRPSSQKDRKVDRDVLHRI